MMLFPLAVAVALWQAVASPAVFDELVARARAEQKTIDTIGAAFTETTVSTLLARPLVARGTLVAAKPSRVVMRYTSPEAKTVTIDRERLTIVWTDPPRRERINIAATQKRVQKYFVDASADELRRLFDIITADDPAAPNTVRVDMMAKRKQIRQGLERLEVWLDSKTMLMARMRMTFPGGDTKTIDLSDVKANVPFDESR